MFEVPRAFGAFDSLFKNLGTTQAPTASDYAVFLKVGLRSCPPFAVQSNERRARCLRLFVARVSIREEEGGEACV